MNHHIKKIQTVLGLLDSKELGLCQCHEHLFIADGQSAIVNPDLRIDDFRKTISELEMFKESGGVSLVDAQPIGCGRMTKQLVEASKFSGINIIASTGFHKSVFYPKNHWIFAKDELEIAKLFINELENGMFVNADNEYPSISINNPAGIIKTALDDSGLTGYYRKLFSAAAYASKKTGISILCHTELGKHAIETIKFLTEQGVKESSIIICHLDRIADNVAYHKAVADMGVYLEYDTIGRFKYHDDEQEIELIRQMIEYGFEDRILLGLDTTRARLKSYGSEIGLSYIIDKFIPMLKRSGIEEQHIREMMIKNPSRALSVDC